MVCKEEQKFILAVNRMPSISDQKDIKRWVNMARNINLLIGLALGVFLGIVVHLLFIANI